MDSLKIWLVEVGYKKLAPSLIKGALAALVGLVAAHQGALDFIGITYDKVGNCLVLDLDKFANWMFVASSGGIMAAFTAIQHHMTAAVVDAPQSGDMRKMDPVLPPLNGERKEDPKL